MRAFTAQRTADTPDEIWLVEHDPVFTQGLAGKAEHLLDPGSIAVLRTERGGQVTFHGPGQVVAYLMLDLRRRGLGVRDLVCRLEQVVIDLLADLAVRAERHPGAPGVYVSAQSPREAGAKIASLGLKVSRGCTFHGLALNVAMDLAPFGRINPCGQPGLAVTDLSRASGVTQPPAEIAVRLGAMLADALASPD
jgi:lipoyl(octanoyl) transferase